MLKKNPSSFEINDFLIKIVFICIPFSFLRTTKHYIEIKYLGQLFFCILLFTLLIMFLKNYKFYLKKNILIHFIIIFVFSIFFILFDGYYFHNLKKILQIFFIFFSVVCFYYLDEKYLNNFKFFFYSFFLLNLYFISSYILDYNIYINKYKFIDAFEAINRKNVISWLYLIVFFLVSLYDFKYKKIILSYISIIIVLFCAVYIQIIFLIVLIFYLKKKNNYNFIRFFLLFFLIFNVLFFLNIIFYFEQTLSIINNFFLFFYPENTYPSSMVVFDKNNMRIYNIISYTGDYAKIIYEDLYIGIVSRLVIFKNFIFYFLNNHEIATKEFYNLQILTYDFKILNYDKFYSSNLDKNTLIKTCLNLKLNLQECLFNYLEPNIFNANSKISLNTLQAIFDIQILHNYNLKFSSPHNEILSLIKNFKFFSIFIFLYIYCILINLVFNKNISSLFTVYVISILFLSNLDNYIFQNYFNLSLLIWISLVILKRNLIFYK